MIANWIGDFLDTVAYAELPQPAKEYAEPILSAFLERACGERGVEPAELEEADLKAGLLEGVGDLELPGSARAVAPELCAAFLAEMERQGRLAGGRVLGLYVKALRGALNERANPQPIRNPGAPIGRNDPCPCGSGKKYKKCCMR